MGDKDTNMLFGNRAIFIGESEVDMKPLGKVVENSTKLNPDDAVELDRLSVREKMLAEPLHIKPLSFDCDIPIEDIAPIIGFDEAFEPSRCSLIIQRAPIINKPKNLKYPNKKRARRIWKKWGRRLESKQEIFYSPEMVINCQYDGDCVSVNMKPIKEV